MSSNKPNNLNQGDDIAPEYDFSHGVRGKHYRAMRNGYTVIVHREEYPRVSTMIDPLKQVFDRAAQQTEEEQAALAAIITQILDDDAKWDALFADPLTPEALDRLAAEAIAEDEAGLTEDITGDEFLS